MVSPDKSAGKQLHEGLASLLAATVSNSGKTRIEIARQTSIHKDALRRILTGERAASLAEASHILNALVSDKSELSINPFMVLNELEAGLKAHSLISNEETHSISKTSTGASMTKPETPLSGGPANAVDYVAEPSERLLRLPEVMERVGLRRTAIYQRMREGRFPQSRSLGSRCTVWVESEVNDWIARIKRS